MKINIFYRHYNSVDDRFNGQGKHSTIFSNESTGESTKVPIRPKWFNYEDCFRNLLDTIKGKDVELHLIMDGDVEKGFMKNYKDHFTLHTIKAGSDQKSFNKTWEVAKSLKTKDDELFYFLENYYILLYYEKSLTINSCIFNVEFL